MGRGQPSDVLEPGRADRQTRDQVALGGEGEEGLALLADEPAVVLLLDVVGEACHRPAVGRGSQPVDRSRRVVLGRPRTVDVGEGDDPVGDDGVAASATYSLLSGLKSIRAQMRIARSTPFRSISNSSCSIRPRESGSGTVASYGQVVQAWQWLSMIIVVLSRPAR